MALKPSTNIEHWADIAKVWRELLGSPLRPHAEDIALFTKAINLWANRYARPPRALILGVTPEIYHLPWPRESTLLAVDHTQGMIDALWPGTPQQVICANWTDLPLKDNSYDIVLSDGGLSSLSYALIQQKLIPNLHRVLAGDGICVFRLYVPPEEQESPKDVFKDLFSAKIPDLNVFKLRLWMALQKDTAQGIELARVWEVLHQAVPDFSRLAEQLGWPLDHVLYLNTYRNRKQRFYFFSLNEIRHLFCHDPGGFSCKDISAPNYTFGENCPTVILHRL